MSAEAVMLIEDIQKRILDGKYLLTNHARAKMNERIHVREDIEDLIMNWVIIEEYLRIITVYWPEDDKWENYRLRKSN
jgi:hypothetical protein